MITVTPKELSLALTAGKEERLEVALRAAEILRETLRPRTAVRIFLLCGNRIDGTQIELQGCDIAAHLQGCHSVALLAATVGAEVDDAIERLKACDLALAHAVDYGAAIAVEKLCDNTENLLRKQVKADGNALTPRFSCGYGDFPLCQQTQLLGLLAAFKTVGIAEGGDFTMYPSKSVTAVMGIGKGVSGIKFDCKNCRYNTVCQHKLCAR